MEIYTVLEVARLLKVSESIVRRIMKSGDLGHIKVMGSYRVTKDQFDDYILNLSDDNLKRLQNEKQS